MHSAHSRMWRGLLNMTSENAIGTVTGLFYQERREDGQALAVFKVPANNRRGRRTVTNHENEMLLAIPSLNSTKRQDG